MDIHSCADIRGPQSWSLIRFHTDTSMIGENRQLVTDEPVEFEEKPVEVQDCRKITDHFRGIYGLYPILTRERYNREALSFMMKYKFRCPLCSCQSKAITIPISKLLFDFVRLLLKCGLKIEATHLSPDFFK